MLTTGGHVGFLLPPVMRNARGTVRTAGFELEFSELSLQQSADIVRGVFGGEHVIESTFKHVVKSRHGDFSIEIDSRVLKKRMYEEPMRLVGLEPDQLDTRRLEEVLLDVFATFAPIEIACPPIPMDQLAPLEDLRRRLHERGAKGTRAAFWYAFGFHINAEVPSTDATVLRDHLRAFLLLYPWIKDRADVDAARQLAPFINPFPEEYVRRIVAEDGPALLSRLLDDYLAYNPTRNRPLDMLPVLAMLDRERVERWLPEGYKPLLSPRPTFHFRLPNCMIDERDWTLAREWNKWVAVERLASDPPQLAEMSRDYLVAEEESFKPFYDKWPGMLEDYMK
jgi:hypothetical protein